MLMKRQRRWLFREYPFIGRYHSKGEVLGLRVIEHHETPGLGDKIELPHF